MTIAELRALQKRAALRKKQGAQQVRLAKSTPTQSQVFVNAPLTNISVAYVQSQNLFVAHKVFPMVPVTKQGGLYYRFNREDFLRDEARPRADGTESAGGGFAIDTAPYFAIVEAFHKDIGDQTRANADGVLAMDRATTEYVTQKLLIRRERKFVTNFFGTGIWGTDITPATLWSNSASTPDVDVEAGKLVIARNSGGLKPNKLILGPEVFSALRYNPRIRDQFKYTSAESISTAMMARFFDVDEVMVAGSVFSNTVEGGAVTAPVFNFGKNALLCYTTNSPSLMTPTAGYTFSWNQYTGSVDGVNIARFRMQHLKSDRIEGEIAHDMRVVAPGLGYFFNGAVA